MLRASAAAGLAGVRDRAPESNGHAAPPEPVYEAEVAEEPKQEQPPPRPRDGNPALPAAQEKLNDLLKSLQLGPPDDEHAVLEWLGGTPWTATVSQVRTVTGQLKDFLDHAAGDFDEARTAIWVRYNELHAEETDVPGD